MYTDLFNAIDAIITTNGTGAITAATLRNLIKTNIVPSLGALQYKGIAVPATVPGNPDTYVFYIATTAGTYANFGGIILAAGEIAFLVKLETSWRKDLFYTTPPVQDVLPTWSNIAYVSGSKVNYNGFDWVANAATLATDIPGTSSKWIDRLLGKGNKTDVDAAVAAVASKLTRTDIMRVKSDATLVNSWANGYWSTSRTTIVGEAAGQRMASTSLIAITPGQIIYFYGAPNTPNITGTSIGSLFGATGTRLEVALKSSLVPLAGVSGAFTYTIPSTAGLAFMGVTLSDLDRSTAIVRTTPVTNDDYELKPANLPITDAPYVLPIDTLLKKNYLTGSSLPSVVTRWQTGYWSSSGQSIVVDALYLASNLITVSQGIVIYFYGLYNTLNQSGTTMGRLYGSTGSLVASVTKSQLVAVPGRSGAYTFTIPVECTSYGISIDVNDGWSAVILLTNADTGIGKIRKEAIPDQSTTDTEAIQMYQQGAFDKPVVKSYGLMCIGQSNMAGRIAYTELPNYGASIPGVNICNNTNESITTNNSTFVTYGVAANATWSFELYVYKLLLDYWITKSGNSSYNIYSIKHAVGATPIEPTGSTNATAYWTPRFNEIPVNKGALLKGLEARYKAIMATATGLLFDIRCVIKHQGEGDFMVGDLYYQNAKNELFYIRGILKNPLVPYLFMGINSSSAQYNAQVENAKIKLASELRNVYYVPSLNGTQYLKSDVLHQNAAGAQPMAQAVFDIIKDFMPLSTFVGEKPL